MPARRARETRSRRNDHRGRARPIYKVPRNVRAEASGGWRGLRRFLGFTTRVTAEVAGPRTRPTPARRAGSGPKLQMGTRPNRRHRTGCSGPQPAQRGATRGGHFANQRRTLTMGTSCRSVSKAYAVLERERVDRRWAQRNRGTGGADRPRAARASRRRTVRGDALLARLTSLTPRWAQAVAVPFAPASV
jgi:hypothetical protein